MIAAVGRTGYGKSSKVRQHVRAHRRVIIVEQKPEKVKDWAGLDVEWYRSADELKTDLQQLPPGSSFRVGIVPGLSGFVDVLRLAWALGDVLLVIEEAGKYFPYAKSNRKRYHGPVVSGGNMMVPFEFLEICERGRHAGPRGDGTQPVGVLITSQRPKRLPLCFQSELDRVYAFMLRVKHDRAWLAECPGSDDELAEETKSLPRFHYLNIPGEGEVTRETTTP
jgi:hypothetical protein